MRAGVGTAEISTPDFGVSSNGRTRDFGSLDCGSTPHTPTKMQPYSSELRKLGKIRVFLDSYNFPLYGHTKYYGIWSADDEWYEDWDDWYDWCDYGEGGSACNCGLCSTCLNMDPDNLPSLDIRQALAAMHYS